MDFTAIDFETACSNFTSLCSMGICVVEDNEIVHQEEILIKPVPFEFKEYNIKIHGITPEAVMFKPTFDKYWDYIRPYLHGKTVIAHNTSFDITALCATLDMFGIEYPTCDYLCTVKLSQKAYPELRSHKLNNLCEALGISFSHHHAYDDAYACARVLLRILEDYSLNDKYELAECFETELGHLYPDCKFNTTKNKKRSRRITNRKIDTSGIR